MSKRSSYTITLFSTPPPRNSEPSAFVVSVVLHSFVFALLFASVRHVRVVDRRMSIRDYSVRLLDVQQSHASVKWFPKDNNLLHHGKAALRHAISPGGRPGVSQLSQVAQISRNFETPKPAMQTLIQPQVPPDAEILPKIAIPQAMVWTPDDSIKKKIVPPDPKPTGAIQVKPSLKAPNRELNPAEVSLSSIPFVTTQPMPVPGTTSPVKVNAPVPAQALPQTASKDTSPPTPSRVISLSKQKLDEGTAALPMVNEIAEADASGSPTPGVAGGGSASGRDASDSRKDGTGTGHGAGNSGDPATNGTTVEDGSNAGSGQGFSIDDGSGGAPAMGDLPPQHIVLPKNGQYGMVIVGASPEEDYPETAGLWTGRVVYTVYLQTDTQQNWILQYSLLKNMGDDPDPSRPEPPWPYDMMRPSLGAQDVVLVHGFINTAGRFEQLSVAYPPSFPRAEILLRALKRWEFRPAMNAGQPATVEILLVVPGDVE